jgi:hypothetical protein
MKRAIVTNESDIASNVLTLYQPPWNDLPKVEYGYVLPLALKPQDYERYRSLEITCRRLLESIWTTRLDSRLFFMLENLVQEYQVPSYQLETAYTISCCL